MAYFCGIEFPPYISWCLFNQWTTVTGLSIWRVTKHYNGLGYDSIIELWLHSYTHTDRERERDMGTHINILDLSQWLPLWRSFTDSRCNQLFVIIAQGTPNPCWARIICIFSVIPDQRTGKLKRERDTRNKRRVDNSNNEVQMHRNDR